MHLRAIMLAPLSLLACQQYPEITDYGSVCVSAEQDGDLHTLVVEARSDDCASDHEGASFECSISLDGDHAHVGTVFQDGKDPDHSCQGPIVTTCELDVDPGTYTLEFAGVEDMIEVPGDSTICLPVGQSETGGEADD